MFRSLCFISCAVTCSKLFFSVEAASLLGDVCDDVVDEVVFLFEETRSCGFYKKKRYSRAVAQFKYCICDLFCSSVNDCSNMLAT